MRTVLPALLGLLVLLVVAVPCTADEPEPEPAPAAPAAEPSPGAVSKAEIEQLVRDLGAPAYDKRVAAFQRLVKIGEPARPALEEAMRSAESPETRWRAEQILSRLDRERERPMDSGGVLPPAPRPGERPPNPPGSRLEELQQRWEKMRELLERDFGMFGPLERSETLTAPGLKLEIRTFGSIPKVTLHVALEPDEATGRPREDVYRSRQLEDILARHPELASHAGMKELQEKWGAFKRRNKAMFPEELFRMHGG